MGESSIAVNNPSIAPFLPAVFAPVRREKSAFPTGPHRSLRLSLASHGKTKAALEKKLGQLRAASRHAAGSFMGISWVSAGFRGISWRFAGI